MRQKWFSVLGDEPEQTEEEQDSIKVCFELQNMPNCVKRSLLKCEVQLL